MFIFTSLQYQIWSKFKIKFWVLLWFNHSVCFGKSPLTERMNIYIPSLNLQNSKATFGFMRVKTKQSVINYFQTIKEFCFMANSVTYFAWKVPPWSNTFEMFVQVFRLSRFRFFGQHIVCVINHLLFGGKQSRQRCNVSNTGHPGPL